MGEIVMSGQQGGTFAEGPRRIAELTEQKLRRVSAAPTDEGLVDTDLGYDVDQELRLTSDLMSRVKDTMPERKRPNRFPFGTGVSSLSRGGSADEGDGGSPSVLDGGKKHHEPRQKNLRAGGRTGGRAF